MRDKPLCFLYSKLIIENCLLLIEYYFAFLLFNSAMMKREVKDEK